MGKSLVSCFFLRHSVYIYSPWRRASFSSAVTSPYPAVAPLMSHPLPVATLFPSHLKLLPGVLGKRCKFGTVPSEKTTASSESRRGIKYTWSPWSLKLEGVRSMHGYPVLRLWEIAKSTRQQCTLCTKNSWQSAVVDDRTQLGNVKIRLRLQNRELIPQLFTRYVLMPGKRTAYIDLQNVFCFLCVI